MGARAIPNSRSDWEVLQGELIKWDHGASFRPLLGCRLVFVNVDPPHTWPTEELQILNEELQYLSIPILKLSLS